ncbi:hypothetical protein [Jatrophihabitans fulvus]
MTDPFASGQVYTTFAAARDAVGRRDDEVVTKLTRSLGFFAGYASYRETWRRRFEERSVRQPFLQIEREVFDGDPSEYWNVRVEAASLHALVRHGWHWGPAGRRALRISLFRPLGPGGTVTLCLDPGVSAVSDTAGEPAQRIDRVVLTSRRHDDLAVFGDPPRVTRSELLHDLSSLRRV